VSIRSISRGTGSCLPQELLQHHGRQLLQALAAPLQQLLLSSPLEQFSAEAITGNGRLEQQLFALEAAAAGVATLADHTLHVEGGLNDYCHGMTC
jgi:hypothetical protein